MSKDPATKLEGKSTKETAVGRSTAGKPMEHSWIDDQQIIERYVLERLSAAETERFEEHYIGCARCLDELEAAERLHAGLQGVAAQEAAKASFAAGMGALIIRFARSRAALGLALALVLVPSLLLWRSNADLKSALEQARAPQVNLPLIYLSPARSLSTQVDGEIDLPTPSGRVVLALDLGEPSGSPVQARLENPSGRVLWQRSNLLPDDAGLLVISLPDEIFDSGDHALEIGPSELRGEASSPLLFKLRIAR